MATYGCLYFCVAVVLRPFRPCWAMLRSQLSNSSGDRSYIFNAVSRDTNPQPTAATTAALREATHRRVVVGGRSARVIVCPFGNRAVRAPSTFRKYIFCPKLTCEYGQTGL